MKFAQLLNIQLIKIPEGTTDLFQPLDCRIFGVLKNHSRTFHNLKIIKELEEKFDIEQAVSFAPIRPLEEITKKHAVIVLELALFKIEERLILDAWNESLLKYFEITNQGIYVFNDKEISDLFTKRKFTDDDTNYQEII